MMKNETNIDKIVNVIRESGLSPSKIPDIVNWYMYAFKEGMVCTERDNDKFGFVDWIRIPLIPKSVKEAREIFSEVQEGPVMMILSCYADTSEILWKLKRSIMEASKDCAVLIWHNKKKDKMFVYKNRRKA